MIPSCAGGFFGRAGSFEEGWEFDAGGLEGALLDHPQELSLRARLDRCIYLADDRQVFAKYVAGNKIF